jgi:hypothetical protein
MRLCRWRGKRASEHSGGESHSAISEEYDALMLQSITFTTFRNVAMYGQKIRKRLHISLSSHYDLYRLSRHRNL